MKRPAGPPKEVLDARAAQAAWRRGMELAAAGDRRDALLWLARAARLAPEDARVAFDLANLRTGGDDAELEDAACGFGRLAERYDVAGAWIGLIAARRRQGRPAAAAAALAGLLGRHLMPAASFGDVASLVAHEAGAPGWCGADAEGRLRLGIFGDAAPELGLDGAAVALTAGDALPARGWLTVTAGGRALLGSPIDLTRLHRVEGILREAGDGGLEGWASRPAAPDAPPQLTLTDAAGRSLAVACRGALPPDLAQPFGGRHRIRLSPRRLAGLQPPFRVTAAGGSALLGSPIAPLAGRFRPIPAGRRGPAVTTLPAPAPLAIVIPLYRGLADAEACLASLRDGGTNARIVLVDDATPEPALAAWADAQAAAGAVTLIRHAENRGFPAAVNSGLAAAPGHDILLLNSDTLVPPGAIDRLHRLAYSRADAGSVTPLSGAATICNYPNPAGGNAMPGLAGATRLDALAAAANGDNTAEIPTGVGFCMLLRHDCLAATGGFRPEIFAQGYGEENDWCLRARALGYAHLAATGVYVAHRGGVSFRAAGQALNARNGHILNRLYPGYDAWIQTALRADRLAPSRRRLDEARFLDAAPAPHGAALLISHNHGGGVEKMVRAEMARLAAAGIRPLLLFPAAPEDRFAPFPWAAELTDDAAYDYPNLRFTLPRDLSILLALLARAGVSQVVLHHTLGHHPLVRRIAEKLGVPQDVVIHDFSSFCLRVNLLTKPDKAAAPRYCGEPNLAGCVACIARLGDATHEGIGVAANLRRSAKALAAARRVTAPSADAANRIARHFPGIRPAVTPWSAPPQATPRAPRRPGTAGGRRRVAVIGGIGPAKGYDVLRACAEDAAARGLPLDFLIAGASSGDPGLLATGRVFITGAYKEAEAVAVAASLDADFAFLPSIWPETWCFTLGEAWEAGLAVAAFDLGAQAERIRAAGGGMLLPLGLPPPRVNDALLAWRPDSRQSSNRRAD